MKPLILCMIWLCGSVTALAQPLKCKMVLTYKDKELSAMLILKDDETGIRGSMINEFGVNFVDFKIVKEKTKIIRLNPMLKKPLLKKVLKSDFKLIADGLYREGEEEVWSKKRGILWAFCKKQRDEDGKLLSLQVKHKKWPLTIDLYPF